MKIKNKVLLRFLDQQEREMNEVRLFQKKINKGVKFLDKKFGRSKWLKKINIQNLDLSENKTCMLGQAYGAFWDAVSCDGEENANQISKQESIDFGFYSEPGTQHEYDLLTYLWFKKITALKAKK